LQNATRLATLTKILRRDKFVGNAASKLEVRVKTKSGTTKAETGIRAGGWSNNENQTFSKSGVKIRSGVKGGGVFLNENQTVSKAGTKVRSKSKVRSGVKAGKLGANENQTLKKSN